MLNSLNPLSTKCPRDVTSTTLTTLKRRSVESQKFFRRLLNINYWCPRNNIQHWNIERPDEHWMTKTWYLTTWDSTWKWNTCDWFVFILCFSLNTNPDLSRQPDWEPLLERHHGMLLLTFGSSELHSAPTGCWWGILHRSEILQSADWPARARLLQGPPDLQQSWGWEEADHTLRRHMTQTQSETSCLLPGLPLWSLTAASRIRTAALWSWECAHALRCG